MYRFAIGRRAAWPLGGKCIERPDRVDYYKLPNIDVRLLVTFDEIHKHKSLTMAANALGLTQSAISRSLQRLRQQFGARCSYANPKGWSLPPCTNQLAGPFALILNTYFGQMFVVPAFDPLTSHRRFTIHASDLGLSLLPQLAHEFSARAPNTRFRSLPHDVFGDTSFLTNYSL